MRGAIVSLVLLVVSLAGCSDGPGASETPGSNELGGESEPESGATGTDNETKDPTKMGNENITQAANTAPTGTLDVTSVVGLSVIFSIQSSDADGDNVTWKLYAFDNANLTADGNGTANITVDYPAPGDYVATLRLFDGLAATNLTANVTVVGAAPAQPGQHATGTWTTGVTMVGCFGDIFSVGYPEALDGVAYRQFNIEPHTIGYGYTAAVSAPFQDSPGFAFLKADRSVIKSDFMAAMATGFVPDDAALGVWWTCAGANLTGAYESTPPL